MTPKERELRQQLEQAKNEARQLVEAGKLEDAKKRAADAKAMAEQIEILRSLEELNAPAAGVPVDSKEAKEQKAEEAEYRKAFMKVLRMKPVTTEERDMLEKRAMSEGSAADGGLVVPQDIQTRINEFKRTYSDLTRHINIEPVTVPTGSRVYEIVPNLTPFANIAELTDIAEMDNPQVQNVTYSIKDYGGIMHISNNLLQDSDQNIMAWVSRWIARKSVFTRNSLITAILNTLDKIDFADWKAMKKALNITLDPMLAAGAIIMTNQDGFQYLDTLTDGMNRPLLKPDVTQPSNQLLFGKPVVIVSNKVLPTTGTTTKKAPVIIGDLAETVTMYERQGYLIASTNVGGSAFARNSTDVRVIEREDVKKIDGEAAVYGQVDVTAVI